MVKRKLFSLLLAAVFLFNLLPGNIIFASNATVCSFGDNFEGYPGYGRELFPKRWDVVIQDTDTGSGVTLEQNDGNGFAAFKVKAGLKEGEASSAVVSIKKNGIKNKDRSLVYEGSFYTFDRYAKMSVSFTNTQNFPNIEMLTLKGNELNVRDSGNLVSNVSDTATMKDWNKISLVLDGTSSELKAYLNGVQVTGEIPVDLSALDMGNLSLKIAVKNNTGVSYTEGSVYMDDFYIYEGTEPVKSVKELSVPETVTTYLNKQFTSVVTDGKAPGVASFYSTVNIVDSPDKNNKSAAVTLGRDGAYFPLEKTAESNFTAKIIYKADHDVTLFARNAKGKEEKLVTLSPKNDFSAVRVVFDLEKGKCAASYGDHPAGEAALSLKDVACIGFYGEQTELVLNKVFAYSGTGEMEDSYFKDYSYQKKTVEALVKPDWVKTYQMLSQGIFLGIDFYQASVFGNKLRYEGQPPRVFNNTPYVPVKETVIFLGGELTDGDGENGGIQFSANGRSITLKPEELYRTKDTDYVTAQVLADAFGLVLSWDGTYLLGFGTQPLFSSETDHQALTDAVHFQRPTGEEIFDRIQKAGDVHPRIMANSERIAEVRENINRYPTLRQWYDNLKAEADSYLDTYALYFTKPDGIRLLSVSNLMVSRMQALGIAYKMTGDTKYAEAAWRDLEAVCKFRDWNPSHYLDVGTMSIGVSIGYSWFYDYLTDEQKDFIVSGFERCGLASYISVINKSEGWSHGVTNWNPWCNGGILSAIVAMSDRLGDNAKYALDRMFVATEGLYPGFVPDGAWGEGISYHGVTLRYLSMWCETLKTATGKDYGYWDLPGMDITAYFGEALSGGGGVFNYGDNTETRTNCQAQEWFALKYKDPALAQVRYNSILTNNYKTDLYDLLMTHPEMMGGKSEMERDLFYKNMQIVSMRTSWEDMSDGIFLAAKGGENGTSHFHYDLGGFVMDVGGVRFAYELGREGYATTANDSKTYQYKKRAEGHNTYVFNPSEDPGQTAHGTAKIIDFQTKERGGYAVMDLTNAYKEARSMKRGFWLTNDRQTMVIQDEVELSGLSEAYWFMHTKGNIELSQDGKTAYITSNGVTARMDILDSENAGAVFEVKDALPLPTTPWLDGQGKNEAYKKLTIHWNSVQKYTLAVAVSQVIDRSIPAYTPAVVPMSQWSIKDGKLPEKAKLTSITKDGGKLEGFSPDKYSYVVQLPYDVAEKPVYQYYADEAEEVTVIDSPTISGQTKFIVKNKESGFYALYSIMTKIQGCIGEPPGAKEAEIVKVTASAEPEYNAGNRAVCVLDGDYKTRWTAEGEQWIMLELKEPVNVYALGVAWYQGDSRSYLYDLEISEDGENWTQVQTGTSSGETTKLECFLLGNPKAKYIRYQGHGHAAGTWNNIAEMRVYVKE